MTTPDSPTSSSRPLPLLGLYAAFVTVACGVLVWQTVGLRKQIEALQHRASEAIEQGSSGALLVGQQTTPLKTIGCSAGEAGERADALEFGDGRLVTVLLLVSGGCDICTHSFPYFHALAESLSGEGMRFATVQVDAHAVSELKHGGTASAPSCAVESAEDTWLRRAPMVPAVVVVDAAGVVRKTYFGELSARQQGELHALLVSLGDGR